MRSIVRQLMDIGILFHFLGIGSTVFFSGSCTVVEARAASFSPGASYEFFSESERAEMEEESWEVLANAVPAALALAIKRQDPFKILDGVGEEGWSSVQTALVQFSSIIYHGLGFFGPKGDGSALWSSTCGR
ncbi:hypothetical protein C7212DRAFT_361540 [Tuber magnatum]|uniref:Uncharacterized protein n=1 Tax=Tuber magnatum TaxID=42249 RepID=A0A317T1L6_9PEZI|nr:hypothetical protein C7212DRAFT_361540 [Tuber magnatum]